MTNLITRITERIAQDRAMLAAGTQGKWGVEGGGRVVAAASTDYVAFCQTRVSPMVGHFDYEGLRLAAANAALIAACVNGKEQELRVIEADLTMHRILVSRLARHGSDWRERLPLLVETLSFEDQTFLDLALKSEAKLTNWLEGREADEKA